MDSIAGLVLGCRVLLIVLQVMGGLKYDIQGKRQLTFFFSPSTLIAYLQIAEILYITQTIFFTMV